MSDAEILYDPYALKWGEEIHFPSTRSVKEYGNRIYNRYPARSIFLVPRAILANKTGLNILDPFMGSGTTAIEAVLTGNHAYGLEMDPFARLVAESSSAVFSDLDIAKIKSYFQKISLSWQEYAPADIPSLKGIERWFKGNDLMDLLKLKTAILELSPKDYLPFFLVTFADAIKPVSLMERQSLKPYISTKFVKETKSVPDSFKYSFGAHMSAMQDMQMLGIEGGGITWLGDDATDFSAPEDLIDIAITSPPYINALDYTRCVKIEGSLCDTIDDSVAATLRETQVGHERRRKQDISEVVEAVFSKYFSAIAPLDLQRAETCRAYFNDIHKNLQCVFRALKSRGEYHIIVGDNTIKGIDIPTHDLIQCLAENVGFEPFGYYFYEIRDHRTSIPRNNAKSKINVEHVLMLRKP